MLSLLLAAAQLSLPIAIGTRVHDVRAIFSNNDFPEYLIRSAPIWRVVFTRTTVRPDGTTQGCIAEISSGDSELDSYTCHLIVKRAKFQAATWTDGSPAYGVLRMPVAWVAGSSPPPPRATPPHLELSVNRLPKGAHSDDSIFLEIAADASGHVLSCAEQPPLTLSNLKRHFPELVEIACEQAAKTLTVTPAHDETGKPVRSVQSLTVGFKTSH